MDQGESKQRPPALANADEKDRRCINNSFVIRVAALPLIVALVKARLACMAIYGDFFVGAAIGANRGTR